MTAVLSSVTDNADQISSPRAEVLAFAERMVLAGSVVVTSPAHPSLVEHRIAARDAEQPGYVVVFLSVTDGTPEVTTINFDLDDDVAARHLPHPDGRGLTMCDARHRALVTYRVG